MDYCAFCHSKSSFSGRMYSTDFQIFMYQIHLTCQVPLTVSIKIYSRIWHARIVNLLALQVYPWIRYMDDMIGLTSISGTHPAPSLYLQWLH